jgi:hypothetical protein
VPVVDPELRAYLDQRFDAVDRRFDAIDQRLDAHDERFDAHDRCFVVIDQRFVAIDQRFDDVDRQLAELRRHSGVLIEQVRHEVQIVAEMVVANTEAITRLRLGRDTR